MSALNTLVTTAVANEVVRDYAPGSAERVRLRQELARMSGERADLPLVIDGREIRTGMTQTSISPHEHARVLGDAHIAGATEIDAAIAAAKRAWHDWSRTSWQERARIFLRAADLVSGPWRDRLNAATMLGQSKTVYQAEIDSAAELADFLRFNVQFMQRLYAEQPVSSPTVWNRVDYRPLEGFVYAVTPFNFTAIAGNLPTAPALMGNTVLWKPSATAKLSAHYVMAMLTEAGLPHGVINLLYGDAEQITAAVLSDEMMAGIHFTGSTPVFDHLLKETAGRRYRNYPRIVGETGGKNFLIAHPSADRDALATAMIRGAFEYQGQKCSATSRFYVPRSMWKELSERLVDTIATIEPGDVSDFTRFMGAVIDERAWRRLDGAISRARASITETVLTGGTADMERGYFVPPTLIETADPTSDFIRTEFFGPIATAFVFEDDQFVQMLDHIDAESAYGLTGSVFARDAAAVAQAMDRLRFAAGNFYVNDKSTGAIVGQQPFGGARASGTNDKAGSMWNLARWVSPRTIKETFVPATDHMYPSMRPDA